MSRMRCWKVVSLLQSILCDRADRTQGQPLSCRYTPVPTFTWLWSSHVTSMEIFRAASYRSSPFCSLSCYDNSFSALHQTCLFCYKHRRCWPSSPSDWATSGDVLQVFVCSLCARRWQIMDLFGRTACAQCWHLGWERGGRSRPQSVTEGMLAAACHLEEQQWSVLVCLQRLPGVLTVVDEDWAPPVLWEHSPSGALLFVSSVLSVTTDYAGAS